MSINAIQHLEGNLAIGTTIRGLDGQPGKDGVSPIVTVEEIDNVHRLTITDAEGTKTFDIENGKDGSDGAPGKDGQPGKDGLNGVPGADGYTPVKGVDYFTEDEISEVAAQAAGLVDIPEIPDAVLTVNGQAPDENGNIQIEVTPDAPTVSDSDTIELLAEMGVVDPVSAENGAVYTDANNKIYVL